VAGADSQTSDWGPCEGSVGPGAADSCEVAGDDTDCDGSPNGGCDCTDGASVACGPDTDDGICQRGRSTCSNEEFGACQGAVFAARRDCTSPVDNDCDGAPDDSIDATCTCEVGSTRACGAHSGRDGNGPCHAGTQTCVAGAQNASSSFGTCTGAVGPAQRDSCTIPNDDSDCDGTPNGGCECVAGRGNQPCADDPNNSRCDAQGRCVPCQGNTDCSLVSGGRNLCIAGVCSAPRCGDEIVQPAIGETCDDGNTVSGDGCSKACLGGWAPRGSTAFAATHLCGVLLSGGVVSCWGLNASGQLGNGSTSNSMVAPVLAANISNAVDVAIWGNDSCAVRANGTVACWGASYGPRPIDIQNVSNVTQIAGGMDGFCGRQSNGGVTCWSTSADAAAHSGLSNIVQVARGDRHGCFLRNDGVLLCEGGGSEGERGDNSFDFADVPEPATVFSNIVQVATGYRSTCVRTRNSGFVQCLGTGITAGSPAALPNANLQPVTALGIDNAVKVVAGEQHMCALTADDEVLCWGVGTAVGNGSTSGSARPVLVPLPGGAIDVGAGSFTSCALLDDGSTYCWGSYAPLATSTTPALITFP
jgi:cysteine-rich repeat protein